MKETIKKSILAGIGLAELSVEIAKGAIDVLVKSGELTAEQGKKAIEKLSERAKKDALGIKARVDNGLKKGLEGISLVTLDRFEALEARVSELERRAESADSEA